MIEVELLETEPLAVLQREGGGDAGAWALLQERLGDGIVGGGPTRIEVHADTLLGELEVLRDVRRIYSTELRLGDRLQGRLRVMALERREREASVSAPPSLESIEELGFELSKAGFERELKAFQLESVCRLAALPHGADFSVPGAGKTTVALANFALMRLRDRVQRLLVVAPLAAFASWKEDVEACFSKPPRVAVHLGTEDALPSRPDILLTNYHRLAGDYSRIRDWVARAATHVVLDEAHRVKKGRAGVHGRAALDLSFAASRRDILTGTPAPQGAHDLVALMSFLYPGQARQILPSEAFVERSGREPAVLQETHRALGRYFVRTCKSELGLPKTIMRVHRHPMGPIQKAIYEALLGQYRGRLRLEDQSRRRLRDLGRIVMYLLEAATNPLLLTAGSDRHDLPEFRHEPLPLAGDEHVNDLLARYGEYETPWKYAEVERIVAEAAGSGEKVLVWTSFVRNIRHLLRILERWKPASVHGGIPPRDGAGSTASTTREDELDRFRYDPACTVLVANPAACGEGVSLHHWCHHAVYLDRSFNAGHFLQSQDRIHRLGLAPETVTRFTLLSSSETIDETVDARLHEKVGALALLMDDPGLVQMSLPGEDVQLDRDGSTTHGPPYDLDTADTEQILRHVNR